MGMETNGLYAGPEYSCRPQVESRGCPPWALYGSYLWHVDCCMAPCPGNTSSVLGGRSKPGGLHTAALY